MSWLTKFNLFRKHRHVHHDVNIVLNWLCFLTLRRFIVWAKPFYEPKCQVGFEPRTLNYCATSVGYRQAGR